MAAPLIEASIDIKATPEKVWTVVSDLKRMSEWSPQCKRMIVRGTPVSVGTRTFNINRRGPLVWPTTAKVIRFEPNRELAFRVTENRTVWSYTLTPTDAGVTLTERREVKNGETTAISAALVDKFMGGTSSFEAELQEGMNETLGKIKRAAEAA
ncbi:SRPBCC family protein [Gordonia sp. TBRC 11910]|uniref:SRPBCC family protein n=1 Tax=Gordonia asplenii TaxID=2725283 RepID=A0A848L680_9ACTN|nr:SRPBCC family protein [Gordonia asplenii]NMO04183.1 SRPBCC family protein [Gordonia asplenii]